MEKKSEILIRVTLDQENIPSEIEWSAQDAGAESLSPAKGILLSIFEKDSLDTLKLDLWTKEMQVVEMDRFMFQTLNALSDTYLKSTNNVQLAGEFKQFVHYFGERTEIISPGN
ncbi:MAG: gliding motility protein GldC [Saprospiraceae bacterium]|nr:gliding motility protein GldC [Candidatus Vicinibacter affinis]MBP6172081.1 gliding motility protein GldC [Saprospiraceae bacterium]MBK6571139.1 gliding motility protein GldC [Candidatus Vicinibacter affinis]MBK6822775.1 gliding motility protein GldC [Candidatus Vicinibacter affinis]MBK7304875.1 gliding motility protein GldC [Candidatus Vicinibacter affinis]